MKWLLHSAFRVLSNKMAGKQQQGPPLTYFFIVACSTEGTQSGMGEGEKIRQQDRTFKETCGLRRNPRFLMSRTVPTNSDRSDPPEDNTVSATSINGDKQRHTSCDV